MSRLTVARFLAFRILRNHPPGVHAGPAVQRYAKHHFQIMAFLTVASCIVFLVMTLPQLSKGSERALNIIDDVLNGLFFLEVALKVLSCPSKGDLKDDLKRKRFWIDVIAVLPAVVEWVTTSSKLRVLMAFRFLRIGVMFHTHVMVTVLVLTLERSRTALDILIFLTSLTLIVGCTAVYVAESQDSHWDKERRAWMRGDKETAFQSIPDVFFWGITTISTTGYGDEVPVSTAAKVVASAMMIAGVYCMAMPISVLQSVFSEAYDAVVGGTQPELVPSLEGLGRRASFVTKRGNNPSETVALVPFRSSCDLAEGSDYTWLMYAPLMVWQRDDSGNIAVDAFMLQDDGSELVTLTLRLDSPQMQADAKVGIKKCLGSTELYRAFCAPVMSMSFACSRLDHNAIRGKLSRREREAAAQVESEEDKVSAAQRRRSSQFRTANALPGDITCLSEELLHPGVAVPVSFQLKNCTQLEFLDALESREVVIEATVTYICASEPTVMIVV